jgi:hypothetical protein
VLSLKNWKSPSWSGNSLLPGNQRSNILFKRARNKTLSRANCIYSTPSCTSPLLILYSQLRVDFLINLFKFSDQIWRCISHTPQPCYMPCPFHPAWFGNLVGCDGNTESLYSFRNYLHKQESLQDCHQFVV